MKFLGKDARRITLFSASLSCVLSFILLISIYREHLRQSIAGIPYIDSNGRPSLRFWRRQSTSTPFIGSNYVRMGFHASTVLGDTLYIDGGEASWNTNGRYNIQVPNNNTLSIDLSQSWTPSSVKINTIPKGNGVPVLNYESIWNAPDNESFYLWAGGVSRSLPNANGRQSQNNLWQFNNGSWSQVQVNSASIFPSLNRPAGGMSAFGNGFGYYMGGFDALIAPALNGPWVPDPGLVIYDMSQNIWKNVTNHFDYDGTAFFGGMEYVPIFGQQGLLLAFGGEESGLTQWIDNGQFLQSFSNITIYDPSGSGTWYSQQTTGFNGQDDIPPDGHMFCTVSTQSDAGTYEIFMYGGNNDSYVNGNVSPSPAIQAQQAAFNQVYVLSLPGFVWFRVNDTSAEARTGHTCELVGNRQLLSIGGLNPFNTTFVNFSDPDTSPQGLGVFDMVDLKWTNTYDATAAPYTLPASIKEWYSRPMSNSSVQWSSTALKNIFSHTSSPQNGSVTNPSSAASATASPSSSSSSDHAGAIAGGVVGGLAALALIGAGVFLFLRRRRSNNNPKRYMNGNGNGHRSLPSEFPGTTPMDAAAKSQHYPPPPGYQPQQQQGAGGYYGMPPDDKRMHGGQPVQGGYMSEMPDDGLRSELDPASAVSGSGGGVSELASPHPGNGGGHGGHGHGQGQGLRRGDETYELDAR